MYLISIKNWFFYMHCFLQCFRKYKEKCFVSLYIFRIPYTLCARNQQTIQQLDNKDGLLVSNTGIAFSIALDKALFAAKVNVCCLLWHFLID